MTSKAITYCKHFKCDSSNICVAVDKISTHVDRRVGFSAIADPLVAFIAIYKATSIRSHIEKQICLLNQYKGLVSSY